MQIIPVLLGVSIVVFFLVRAIPGNPAQIMLGQQATQEQVQQLTENMGLDKPIFVQYGLFLKDAVRGDLGDSTLTGRPVTTELLVRFPATFELVAFAMLIAILVGVPVGVIAAVRQYSMLDKTTSVLALTGISMPIFWLAMILVVIFGVNLELPAVSGPPRPDDGYFLHNRARARGLAAYLQLRGVLGRAPAPHYAGPRPCDDPHGRDHADDALQHA